VYIYDYVTLDSHVMDSVNFDGPIWPKMHLETK
jgi:hypothetical protein